MAKCRCRSWVRPPRGRDPAAVNDLLSANQDLLVRSEWGGVEIEDLTRAQLSHFADLIGSRILVDGPKLRLKPAAPQAIGLALHDPATNPAKSRPLSTPSCRPPPSSPPPTDHEHGVFSGGPIPLPTPHGGRSTPQQSRGL